MAVETGDRAEFEGMAFGRERTPITPGATALLRGGTDPVGLDDPNCIDDGLYLLLGVGLAGAGSGSGNR